MGRGIIQKFWLPNLLLPYYKPFLNFLGGRKKVSKRSTSVILLTLIISNLVFHMLIYSSLINFYKSIIGTIFGRVINVVKIDPIMIDNRGAPSTNCLLKDPKEL